MDGYFGGLQNWFEWIGGATWWVYRALCLLTSDKPPIPSFGAQRRHFPFSPEFCALTSFISRSIMSQNPGYPWNCDIKMDHKHSHFNLILVFLLEHLFNEDVW